MNVKRWWQRLTIGYNDEDLWDLNTVISKFVLPRLIAYRNCVPPHPPELSEGEWHEALNKMIFAFDYWANLDDRFPPLNVEKTKEGLELFGKYFYMFGW